MFFRFWHSMKEAQPGHTLAGCGDLNYDLKRLQDGAKDRIVRHPDGALVQRSPQMANALHDLGFRRLRATGLKAQARRGAGARLEGRQGLSVGTMKNRMSAPALVGERGSASRTWCAPDNASYGIGDRRYGHERGQGPRPAGREAGACSRTGTYRMALRLRGGVRPAARGGDQVLAVLRGPGFEDRAEGVHHEGRSAARGPGADGIGQRRLLDEARAFAGGGAMIPGHRNYKQQLDVYEKSDEGRRTGADARIAARRTRCQALRGDHRAGSRRSAGGPPMRSLKGARKRIDRQARATISREMGHSRISIVEVYCGK